MTRPNISNVLADRYASTAMLELWSAEAKIILERQLWIAVLKGQKSLGMDIPASAIEAYENNVLIVNLRRIRKREEKTRHDVKARIEEFNALAGYELIHIGMTSRDLTENVEQMQIKRSMEIVDRKLIAVFRRLAERAVEYDVRPIVGRSHNVAAQVTTLGKRFASTAEELEHAFERLQRRLASYPLRGIKGPVGTQQDMLEWLGTASKVNQLEAAVAKHLGFDRALTSVGQVYPRTLDFDVISVLVQIAAVASNFATTLRLMAGQELANEGFKEGQDGSSAMPHKMNTRSSERICGLYKVLCGHLTMIESVTGDQWNEGDVSCSVPRRVVFPDAFFAIDGLLETWLTVLDEFGVYPAMMDKELQRHLPFLATTKLLTAAVRAGMGRETAHALIKKHAVAAALDMREGKETDLVSRLASDADWKLDLVETRKATGKPIDFIGLASAQAGRVASRIEDICDENPEAANYQPEPIL